MAFEFKFPDIGEGVVEGEIIKWLIHEGDQIEEDQPMVEVMTDKATVEIPSPLAGEVLRTIGAEGDIIQVGATLVVIDGPTAGEAAAGAVGPKSPDRLAAARRPAPVAEGAGTVLATPAVRKFARGKNVDLAQVSGTGRGGRITREDVENFIARSAGPEPAAEEEVAVSAPASVETIPYRGLRRKIGDHLVASKRFAPHYTYVEEVDVTELVALRRQFLDTHPGHRLTYLPFLIKAVIEGLKKFPLLNATLDEDKQVIQLKKEYNIGVATATEQGLVVPVIKNADRKSILQLSEELMRLAEETKQGSIKLADLKNSTFSITSLGSLGGVMATPIINYPEVAILGVHKISRRPVVRGSVIVVRDMMNLSLTLDHRVVDGAVGAQFVHHVIPFLERPGLLAIQ